MASSSVGSSSVSQAAAGRRREGSGHPPESLGATATALISLSCAATAAVTRILAGLSASGSRPVVSHTCMGRVWAGEGVLRAVGSKHVGGGWAR